ncbi:MAG: hypothetical protein AB7I30_00680 [Isosphaeraceae bacterium]
MRLTLRTLLAWLDDKLPPSEVREIGKQVSEIPYAKELVERIHKVTRQRRLTVPPERGPDAVDPNLVAAYIDNELEPERVAEFEKKCLSSDVHLAEVSSTHQILSLVGQKAKVPAEARLRMYGLIKGRESIRPTREEVVRAAEAPPEPEGPQVWMIPEPPRRRWLERFGPVVAVLGLIGILVITAWETLTTDSGQTFPNVIALNSGQDGQAAAERAIAGEPPLTAPAREPNRLFPSATKSEPVPKPAPASEPEGAPAKSEVPAGDQPPSAPDGAIGLARKTSGVLLRFQPATRDWERLTDVTPLREQDRVLGLAPFRSALEVGSANVELVGESEVWINATPRTLAARFSLARGRVVLHGTTPSLPFEVRVGESIHTITPPPGATVGVERVMVHEPGLVTPNPPVIRVHATSAPVRVAVQGGAEFTLEEVGSITLGGGVETPSPIAGAAPSWVTETEPSAFDQSTGGQFITFLREDRPLVSGLVEASEAEEKEVCRLAISALRAVGDVSYIAPLLNAENDPNAPTKRKAAIAVLRSYLAEGPEAVDVLNEQFRRQFGDEFGPLAMKLLNGFSPSEAADEATFAQLVELLAASRGEPVGVRELALDNLKSLTGRDDLGYDPEKPDDKGLKTWRDLLREHELKAAPRKAAGR